MGITIRGNGLKANTPRAKINSDAHLGNCVCDECGGACADGKCGECFVCEYKADDDKFWAVNRADILGI